MAQIGWKMSLARNFRPRPDLKCTAKLGLPVRWIPLMSHDGLPDAEVRQNPTPELP